MAVAIILNYVKTFSTLFMYARPGCNIIAVIRVNGVSGKSSQDQTTLNASYVYVASDDCMNFQYLPEI